MKSSLILGYTATSALSHPHEHLGLLLPLSRLGDAGLEVLHEAHHVLHLGDGIWI